MTHPVAHLKIVVARIVIFGGQPVRFPAFVPHEHRVLGVIVDIVIVIAASSVLAAVFLFDGFIHYYAVPGFAFLSGNDGIDRNY